MKPQPTGAFVFLTVLSAALTLMAAVPAAAQNRITRAIEASEREPVRGNVHPLARPEFDQGKAPASMMLNRMVLMFRPSAAQQADLDALLAEQQNPVSPFYHQWLTPEQYADRFGLSADDVAKVIDWLQARGFTLDETARSRTYVAFSGTAAQVEAAFGTAIHRYTVNGEAHYANASDPVLPAPLAQVALSLHGLHDFLPKARGIRRSSPRPQFTSGISGNHFLAPDDFATIFDLKPLYASGIDGTGQKLAVMGQTDLVMSDINTFRSVSGLPPTTITVTLATGSADPGISKNDIAEANLDLQWSGAVARNATIIYVNSKNGAFDSMNFAVTQNIAPVISISYGDCEANFTTAEITSLTAMGEHANAQGITIVGPSGDSGAADCDFPPANSTTPVKSATHGLAVDIPASLPTVTGAGGTTFNEGSSLSWMTVNDSNNASAIAYIPEVAWNDTTSEIANGGSLAGSGGGASTLFTKPPWQVATGVPADNHRYVPDIAFPSSFDHDGYLVCSQGTCVNGFRQANNNLLVVGGTSASAPVFAGIVALINQQAGKPQGNVNQRLYELAGTSPDAFHDITSGDNNVPCTALSTGCPKTGTIGFSAGPGYDLVTGLGSVDAYNLVMEWPATGSSPPSFTVTASANAGTQYNVSVAPVNGFNGTVNLSVAGLPTGATATFGANSVAINGAAAQSTTVQVATGLGTPAGTYILGVTGTGGKVTRAAGITATLPAGPDFQLAAAPAGLSLTAGATSNVGNSTVTVSALNGFTGPVALSCTVSSTLPGTTCALSAASVDTSGTVTLTVTAPATRASLHSPATLPRFFPWTDGSFALAVGLVMAGKSDRSSRKKWRLALLAGLLVIALAMMAGCGGGTSSAVSPTSASITTTTRSGTVTVQGTSAGLTRSANTIAVVVN